MAARIRAIVKPELLVWARQSLGLQPDVAAKKIGISVERLHEWERGEVAPTIPQLRAAAKAYKRPMAVFYLSEPPKDFNALRDFRRIPDLDERARSPELTVAIRDAHLQRQNALELYEILHEEPQRLDGGLVPNIPPDDLARRARDRLGVELEVQFTWRDEYSALNGWIRALERIGTLVFQTNAVSVDEMRAFSISERPLPTIVVNANDAPRARIFSLMHELGHILRDAGGICDLHEDRTDRSHEQAMEVYCNAFAAALLVPADAFLAEAEVEHAEAPRDWPDDVVRRLARKYRVSEEVVLRRLLTLGKATQRFYEQKREQYVQRYRRLRDTKPEGFAPYHRVVVRDLGKAYVRLTLEAYHRDAINSADVSDYLGIRLQHLSKIEHEMALA